MGATLNTRAALRQAGLSESGIDQVEGLEAQFAGDGASKEKAAELAMAAYLDSLNSEMRLVKQRAEVQGGRLNPLASER